MILYDLERKEKNSECALMYMWPMTSKRKIALSLFVAFFFCRNEMQADNYNSCWNSQSNHPACSWKFCKSL